MKPVRDTTSLNSRIIPAEVHGVYRRRRDVVHLILVTVFLALPWIPVGDTQSILVDISRRQLHFFGIVFQAHEAPLLFFILATFFLGLALVTSLWGRIWCGWACPQTVFIDGIFRRIEFWIEGDYRARRRARESALTGKALFKKCLKWSLFVVVSFGISISFVSYFHETRTLFSAGSWGLFFVVLMTALVLFDFGWFREQFCVIACPYGRFQNVLLDPGSIVVAYDSARGEPRKGASALKKGDCVDCGRCVEVCPTGIDIRQGLQMECINCTACMDACDEIMAKIKKPPKLIGYRTLNERPFTLMNVKTWFYVFLIVASLGVFSYQLYHRPPVDVTLLRGRGAPFSVTADSVINHFRLHVLNQSAETETYSLDLPGDYELVTSEQQIRLAPGEFHEWHFFVKAPVSAFQMTGKTGAVFEVKSLSGEILVRREIDLLGPRTSSPTLNP